MVQNGKLGNRGSVLSEMEITGAWRAVSNNIPSITFKKPSGGGKRMHGSQAWLVAGEQQ